VHRFRVDSVHGEAPVAARSVTHPHSLDVVVGSNLFADILTDLGAAIQGGLGFAPSANINPQGGVPSMFAPVHVSVANSNFSRQNSRLGRLAARYDVPYPIPS